MKRFTDIPPGGDCHGLTDSRIIGVAGHGKPYDCVSESLQAALKVFGDNTFVFDDEDASHSHPCAVVPATLHRKGDRKCGSTMALQCDCASQLLGEHADKL